MCITIMKSLSLLYRIESFTSPATVPGTGAQDTSEEEELDLVWTSVCVSDLQGTLKVSQVNKVIGSPELRLTGHEPVEQRPLPQIG